MPFALLTIGMLLIITGFQDTYKQFGTQLEKDFSGPNSFIYFLVAIGAVGAIGYVKELESFSRAMLALIIVALFLGAVNKGGFLNNLTGGLQSGSNSPVDPIGTPLQGGNGGSSSSGSGGSSSSGGSDLVTAGLEAALSFL